MLHLSLKRALPTAGALSLLVACGLAVGCEDTNTAEEAGERIDDAADETIDATEDAIDDAEDAVDDAVDDINDDPNTTTPPTGG